MFFCENHSGKDLIGKKLHTGIKKSLADTFGGNARHWCFAPTCAHTRILREILFTNFFLSWLEISVDSETLVQKFHTGIKKNLLVIFRLEARHTRFAPTCARTQILSEKSFF